MSWSTPRTWVTSELVTSSIMNTHVRDQFIEVAKLGGYRCYAYRNGNQTVTAGNSTALNLDTEIYDSSTMHDNVTNNTRITVPVAGFFRIHGTSAVSNNNNGTAAITLRKNGSVLTPTIEHRFATTSANWEDQDLRLVATIQLAANDYVELYGSAVSNDFTFTASQFVVEGLVAVA